MFSDLLPSAVGLLPKWQLLVSGLALFNAIQNYSTLSLTKRVYAKVAHQVTPLQARSNALWTFTSAVVRFYCAYNIHTKAVYDMTLATYCIAFAHFTSELFYFRSVEIGAPLLSPIFVSTTSIIWMIAQYGYYVEN
ncbi:ergosterol biosynthesis protein [Tulasnella sp. 419]|nr:ergosterol biosynthesis protein [Tulasnella sp. 418]KAG8969125.1 ergosterol biosynthesis protein [Tulasnella sp. 419]